MKPLVAPHTPRTLRPLGSTPADHDDVSYTGMLERLGLEELEALNDLAADAQLRRHGGVGHGSGVGDQRLDPSQAFAEGA